MSNQGIDLQAAAVSCAASVLPAFCHVGLLTPTSMRFLLHLLAGRRTGSRQDNVASPVCRGTDSIFKTWL